MKLIKETELEMDDEAYLTASKVIEQQMRALGKANLPVKRLAKNSPGLIGDVEQSKKVATMAALGMSDEQIGYCLNIHPTVLRKVFGPVMAQACNIANMQVAKTGLQLALSGDKDMIKFWLQARAGWKVTTATEANVKVDVSVSAARSKLLQGLEIEDAEVVREQQATGDGPDDNAA